MADVFLSYKREERAAVETIASRLRNLGLTVWFDASLRAGETFNAEIDREARAANVVLVCWSPAARQSEWVNAEAMIGFEHKKLAACYVAGPDGFSAPTPFNANHAEDLRAWLTAPTETHPGWKSVLRRIGRLCGRTDIETWGALDRNASSTELRAWLATHQTSPLSAVANAALRAREAELAIPRFLRIPAVGVQEAPAEIEQRTVPKVVYAAGAFAALIAFVVAISMISRSVSVRTANGPQATTERQATTELQNTAVPIQEFNECDDALWCPTMVIVPGGSFIMGSPSSEAGRGEDEGPQRTVIIRDFAVSKFEITRGQYALFAEATSRSSDVDCRTFRTREGYSYDAEATWNDPRFRQSENHPVVCVDWFDASAYVEWLNTRIGGASYRLLTEAEWEFVARAGSNTPYPWGADPQSGCGYENVHDESSLSQYPNWPSLNCRDGFVHTAPVGLFRPNTFGLYDMMGNVSEWVQDCYTRVAYGDVRNSENEIIDAVEGGLGARVAGRGGGSYVAYPVDGSPYEFPDCEEGVFRGGGWDAEPTMLRSALRHSYLRGVAYSNVGFRVAKTL